MDNHESKTMVDVALTLADADTKPIDCKKAEQQACLRRMISELRNADEWADTDNFYEVLALLKQRDRQLERKNYTEVHPSRYDLIKLIEEAERLR
jgi:hypothetical protein